MCKKSDIKGQEYEIIVLLHCAQPIVLYALHNESEQFGVARTVCFIILTMHKQYGIIQGCV